MPELPEVEVVRGDLDPIVCRRTIERIAVGRDRAVRRATDPRAFVAALQGRTITATSRVGKFLVVHLDDADALVVHLGMSGRLLVAEDASVPRLRHTHVVLTLDDGREVRFVDPRTFGQLFVSPTRRGHRPDALAHLGPDALTGLDDAAVLAPVLAGRRVAVKLRLMDQTAIAGLGNIYSDEILHRAGVAPWRTSGSVTATEVEALGDHTRAVLAEAIAARGSSLADAQYVDGFGRPGTFQQRHAVHARAGAPCPRCGCPVTRRKMGGRYASWCRGCQT